jgi:hypothetical protein
MTSSRIILRAAILSHNDDVRAHKEAVATMGRQGMHTTDAVREYVKACFDRAETSRLEVESMLDAV